MTRWIECRSCGRTQEQARRCRAVDLPGESDAEPTAIMTEGDLEDPLGLESPLPEDYWMGELTPLPDEFVAQIPMTDFRLAARDHTLYANLHGFDPLGRKVHCSWLGALCTILLYGVVAAFWPFFTCLAICAFLWTEFSVDA